jgi:hypothetical protein
MPLHELEAYSFQHENGVYIFYAPDLVTKLHAITASPGMLVKRVSD